MSYRTVADDVRPDWRHAAPHDACLRSPITSQVHRRRRFPKNGVFAFCSRHADPVPPSIATCIRVTASCWSIRVAGPLFRKSTDAFARNVALRGGLRFALGRQPFKSNWVRSLPAIASIISERLRILRSVGHDRDLPSVLVGHDRDGEIRRQLADGFHLEPDRGLEFFARFCWLLQSVFGSFGADAKSPV